MVDERVVKYIKAEQKKGFSEAKIRQALAKAKYKRDIVDEAFSSLTKDKSSQQQGKTPNLLLIAIATILVIVAAAALIYSYSASIRYQVLMQQSIGNIFFTPNDIKYMSPSNKDLLNQTLERKFDEECNKSQNCSIRTMFHYFFLRQDLDINTSAEYKYYARQHLPEYDIVYRRMYEARLSANDTTLTKDDQNLLFLIFLLEEANQSNTNDNVDYWFKLLSNFKFADDEIKYKFVLLFNRILFNGYEARDKIIAGFCYPGTTKVLIHDTRMSTTLLEATDMYGSQIVCV